MSVLFHGSFALDRPVLAKMIAIGLKDPNAADEGFYKPFGRGKPFSQRHRSWLHKVGLAELGLPIRLTKLGEVVIKNDPKLESEVTKWFLHHELVTDHERAEAWHFFALEFLPDRKNFARDELLDGLVEKLRSHSEQHFGPGSSLNKTICKKILDVYTADSALGSLGFIRKSKSGYDVLKPKQKGPWPTVSKLQAAYDKA